MNDAAAHSVVAGGPAMVGRGLAVIGIRARNDSGFTLFEILAALAVIGVATGIFASLFVASMNIGHLNQSSAIAATLAEEQLVLLRNHPDGFVWPDAAALDSGEFAPITLRDPATQHASFAQPAVMPFDPRAFTRDRNFYDQFTWEAFARLPDPDAGHLEVVAVVHWQEKGRPQSISLTSAVTRPVAEDGA
jgi:prepilin-type N-terminal cleavage/methylation domain-containing protein